MDPTFDPREVDALVRRAAIAKRESAEAVVVADEARLRAHEKLDAANSAYEELHAYLEFAITRAADRLADVGAPLAAADIVAGPIVTGGYHFHPPVPTAVSDADRALAAQAEREDTGGGACT